MKNIVQCTLTQLCNVLSTEVEKNSLLYKCIAVACHLESERGRVEKRVLEKKKKEGSKLFKRRYEFSFDNVHSLIGNRITVKRLKLIVKELIELKVINKDGAISKTAREGARGLIAKFTSEPKNRKLNANRSIPIPKEYLEYLSSINKDIGLFSTFICLCIRGLFHKKGGEVSTWGRVKRSFLKSIGLSHGAIGRSLSKLKELGYVIYLDTKWWEKQFYGIKFELKIPENNREMSKKPDEQVIISTPQKPKKVIRHITKNIFSKENIITKNGPSGPSGNCKKEYDEFLDIKRLYELKKQKEIQCAFNLLVSLACYSRRIAEQTGGDEQKLFNSFINKQTFHYGNQQDEENARVLIKKYEQERDGNLSASASTHEQEGFSETKLLKDDFQQLKSKIVETQDRLTKPQLTSIGRMMNFIVKSCKNGAIGDAKRNLFQLKIMYMKFSEGIV